MQLVAEARTKISHARKRWLDEESAAWREERLIDESVRERILARYDAESAERRGMLAVVIIAVLMCGVGIALLIGYNWHRIPEPAKVTMLLAFVAAAFGGSAAAYARGRATSGEMLAFTGTLLFGSSIWLIAQVLHISGRYPDAFLWFAIGALACAYLLKSSLIAIEAALLATAWVIAEGTFVLRVNGFYLAVLPIVLLNAYRTRAAIVVPIAAFATAVWAFLSGIDQSPAIAVGAAALLGCAFHAVGRLHRTHEFGAWWQTSGLGVLLCAFVPLLIEGFHRDAVEGRTPGVTTLIYGGIVAVAAMAVVSRVRPATSADRMIAAVAAVTTVWTVVHIFLLRDDLQAAPRLAAVIFSVLALGLGVTLIRSAVRFNRPTDLGLGVLFALVFLVVRWAEAADNLFWTGLFLLVTGGGLLLVARVWQRRDRTAAPGSLS